MVDGPIAADGHAQADSPEDGVREAGLPAVWCRVSRVADVPVDARAAAAVSYGPVRAVSSQAWDALRAVVDAGRCFRLAGPAVWLLALPRAWRRAQAGPGGCPAVLVDPGHATRVAALRRDSRRGGRATAGKTVFPLPLFPLRVFGER